jgi:hypothetical protein
VKVDAALRREIDAYAEAHAHWASQGGTVKVSEDELLAELRSDGADEWEQAVAEAERDLQETSSGTTHKGRH